MTSVEFADAALADMEKAAQFYSQRAPELGEEFLKKIEETIARLRTTPALGSPVSAHCRKLVVKRFPYLVIYRRVEERVIILCVAHQRMHPGAWLQRIR